MNIDIKMIRYYINYELVAHILLILNVILFTIMISTGTEAEVDRRATDLAHVEAGIMSLAEYVEIYSREGAGK